MTALSAGMMNYEMSGGEYRVEQVIHQVTNPSSPPEERIRHRLFRVLCIQRKDDIPLFELVDYRSHVNGETVRSIPLKSLSFWTNDKLTSSHQTISVFGSTTKTGNPFVFYCSAYFLKFLLECQIDFIEAYRNLD